MTKENERNAWEFNFHSTVICPGVQIEVTEIASVGSGRSFQVGDEINCFSLPPT